MNNPQNHAEQVAPGPNGSLADRVTGTRPAAVGVRRTVVLMALVNLVLLGYAVFATGAPPVQAEPALAREVVAEEVEGEPASAVRQPTATPVNYAPAGPSGSRPASGRYQHRGNISDIFCQPWPNETEAEWLARVADRCTI